MKLSEFIEENCDRDIVDIEALEKCLEPKNPKTIYDIKDGEPYYILFSDGVIKKFIWHCDALGNAFRSLGFAFLTEKEAEIRKKILMIEEELIRLGGRREFRKNKRNYYISFSVLNELILYNCSFTYIDNEIYFDTEEQVKEAVKQIGKQRLIDEYFKPRIVEENQE